VANVTGTRRRMRVPVLTIVVFLASTAMAIAQLLHPRLLDDLQRTPAGLHGDWWRTVSTLVVQDGFRGQGVGGVVGGVLNLVFLLVLGAAAEQAVSRWRWLLGYLGAALVGEFVGYAWQPTGGGNSVADCGLAAIIVLAYLGSADRLPAFAAPAASLWLGFLLATWTPWLIVAGIVISGVLRNPKAAGSRGFRAVLLIFAVVVGAVLCGVRNIHGAALLAGLVLAAIPAADPLPATRAA